MAWGRGTVHCMPQLTIELLVLDLLAGVSPVGGDEAALFHCIQIIQWAS